MSGPKSVSLVNPSGRKVRVTADRVEYLLSQGFRPADKDSEDMRPGPPDLARMSLDELRAEAERVGAKHHHNAGPEKIIAAIEAAVLESAVGPDEDDE